MDDLTKVCQYKRGLHIVLYADDILFLASSVNELQHLLTIRAFKRKIFINLLIEQGVD